MVIFGADDPELLPHYRNRFLRLGLQDGHSISLTLVTLSGPEKEDEARARAVVQSRPDVIMVQGTYRARMLQRLTSDIPIVFSEVSHPVELGLVESLRRPGRNVTGASSRNSELIGKRLELLRELRPAARRVGLLSYSDLADAGVIQEFETGARRLGMDYALVLLPRARIPADTVQAKAGLRGARADVAYCYMDYHGSTGLVRHADPSMPPTIFFHHHTVRDGGLISLGEWWLDPDNRAIELAARILRGASPADIPVDQLARPWLAVNLRTARAMGIEIPTSVLTSANEIVE